MHKEERETTNNQPLTVVSNRLPIIVKAGEPYQVEPATGGLVQALTPILQDAGGQWIGWPGITTEECQYQGALSRLVSEQACELHPVMLSQADVDNYYAGFANSIMWPLCHGMGERCSFREEFWDSYLAVNDTFTEISLAHLGARDELIWVHDYHLIPVAQKLRAVRPDDRIGFFLHIPFPNLETYVMLPWRADLLRAFLAYDLLGFQTSRDMRHFLECVERLMPSIRVVETGSLSCIHAGDRSIWVGVFPIGTNAEEFARLAESADVAKKMDDLHTSIGAYQLLVGVDRLDYTKGLLERLSALERALEVYPDLREKVVLLQLVVPSREEVPEYQALKREVDRMVGYINGRFSTPAWSPVVYLYNTLPREELVALYRAASVALVTPLVDGMNLVAKEYVSSQIDESGVLVLSEMAGAAAQLADGALLVNPHDVNRMADAIFEAVTMPLAERRERMRRMRQVVHESDVFWWARSFVTALREPHLTDREPADIEYLPTFDPDGARQGT